MSVLIITNTSKPHAIEATGVLTSHLESKSIGHVQIANEDRIDSLPPDDYRFAVALGGDGTILKAARSLIGTEVPLLGVRFGRLGFLAGCEADDMLSTVDDMIEGNVHIERRTTLVADVFGDDFERTGLLATNEVAMARGASGRIISYKISISGTTVARMRGDGILVASATGSTGYALSAGGPLVAPGFSGLVVVPIAPHTLHARAIVTDPDDLVTVSLIESKRDEGELFIDGERIALAGQPKEIHVRRSEHELLLVRGSHDFYASIASVFFGGSDA